MIMSANELVLLPTEDADDAAIAAALAVLDGEAPPHASLAAVHAPATTPPPPSPPTTAKQAAPAAVASAPLKRCRKRQHTEVLELRSLVTELQERLAQLQRFRKREAHPMRIGSQDGITDEATAASVWFEHAVAEYKKLERAQAWNLRLHHELKSQRETYETLQRLFGLQLSPQVRPSV